MASVTTNTGDKCECGCGETVTPGSRFLRGHVRRLESAVVDALTSGTPLVVYGDALDAAEMVRSGAVKLTPTSLARLAWDDVPADIKRVVAAASKSTRLRSVPAGPVGPVTQREAAGRRGRSNVRGANVAEPVQGHISDIPADRVEMIAQVVSSELYAIESATESPEWSDITIAWRQGYVQGMRAGWDRLRALLQMPNEPLDEGQSGTTGSNRL